MSNTIDADAAKLAGLQIDFLQKYRNEQFTLEQFEWFLGLNKWQRGLLLEGDLNALKPQLLIPGTPVTFGAVEKHKTSNCFKSKKGGTQYWRDGDLDKWTPQNRRAHAGGEYIPHTLGERMQFREMAAEILGVSTDVGDEELQRQLIEGGHCVEMLQIENNILRTEAGDENTGYAKDGKWTFAFVDNYDGSVSVVPARWSSGSRRWRVVISRFGDDLQWYSEIRVLARN